MKKVITTVGTSLITNAKKTFEHFDILNKKTYADFSNNQDLIKEFKTSFNLYFNKNFSNPNISAEIASIIKIANDIKEDIEVYLIATDTILSPVCAEYIKEWHQNSQNEFINNVYFEYNPKFIIDKLQVKRKSDFEKQGLNNLFTRIREIAGGYWDNMILNITGGYKALIPYMSIIAQVYNIPAYYNFQETKDENFDLLQIPNIPLNINYSLFEKYYDELTKVAETGENPNNYSFKTELGNILEIEDNQNMFLTSLGYALWEKYKEQFFVFYCPDDVWDEIQEQKDIFRILQSKFWDKKARENKTERKQEHYVFDDGNNNNRIYYFEKNNLIYIYKTFENEEKARKYINEKINCDNIIKNSKKRRIEINKL